MEQHPVPQNVTTFQFRLIGDMTVKQFGYLAAGAIGGYICYKLPLPFFFTWPLAILSVCLGIGLAFVPIEERPMDVWLLSFIKSIYSPTQYLWQKTAQKEEPVPVVSTKPMAPTSPIPTVAEITDTFTRMVNPFAKQPPPVPAPQTQPTTAVNRPPNGPPPIQQTPTVGTGVVISQQTAGSPFDFLGGLFGQHTPPTTATSTNYPDIFAKPGGQPSLTGKHVDINQPPAPSQQVSATRQADMLAREQAAAERERKLTEQLTVMQKELATRTTTDARILELQKQLTDVLGERNQMERELATLRNKLTQTTTQPQVVRQAGVVTTPPPTQQPTVRIITPESAVKAGLPRLTTFPNVITGIIKDHEGNLLPGVLVTVRDKDEIPVRALKTNKLGQFAASTPLPNGTFTIDIEDPRNQHFFDRIRITLVGNVMAPVEVTSKSKKEMDRNKLASEIFGANQL